MRALPLLIPLLLTLLATEPALADGPATARMGPHRSRIGRLIAATRRKVMPTVHRLGGELTLLADRIEHKLPTRLRRPFRWARNGSPVAAGAFATKKFRKDPAFLLWYGAGSQAATRIGLPLAAKAGLLSPGAATLIYFGSAAIDLGVVAVREHATRDDRQATFGDTLRGLGQQYVETARHRREVNRRYMRRYFGRAAAATASGSPPLAVGSKL